MESSYEIRQASEDALKIPQASLGLNPAPFKVKRFHW